MANQLFYIATAIALLAVVVAFLRLLKGPDPTDRVVALDGMTITSISIITAAAFFLGRVIYIDVAMVYALVSFLGVVAIARFIERGL
ncbi:MAG TPA: cation:proton antiporter [Sediminispirochaeta sp.]|nr:cation:proton antiporter [Sediminispirochaeta sp.]